MRKKVRKRQSRDIYLSVVGTDHRVSISTRQMMREHLPMPVKLEREPDNPVDPRAIKVVIADGPTAKGVQNPYKGLHIGYLRRAIATVYAPLLDRGEIKVASATLVDLEPRGSEGEVRVRLLAGMPKS
jgi:hypothetical protein